MGGPAEAVALLFNASRREAALLHDFVPPLLGGLRLEAVQPLARLAEGGVAMPRLPGLAAVPRADDRARVRLVDGAQELAGHPARTALGRAQALVHRPVPLALGPRLELDVAHDRHHGAGLLASESSKPRTGDRVFSARRQEAQAREDLLAVAADEQVDERGGQRRLPRV